MSNKNIIQELTNNIANYQTQLVGDNTTYHNNIYYQRQNLIRLIGSQQYIDPQNLKGKLEIKIDTNNISIREIFRKIIEVQNPEKPFKVTWDLVGMVFIFIQMITIPLIITFQLELEGGLLVFNDIMDYYFLIDILISFNTGYYTKGTLVEDRKLICKNYLRLWFWFDIVSSFPYDAVISANADETTDVKELQRNAQVLKFVRFIKFIKIIRLVRALKLKKLLNQLEEQLQLDQSVGSIISFLKLCVIILCLAHWLACIWNIIMLNENVGVNWYSRYSKEQGWQSKYIAGIYFSITTMITIGYGEIFPVTLNERIFGIFVMVLSSGLFGYIMNCIALLFQHQDEETRNVIEKNDIMLKYLKIKPISKNLQSRVKNYLEWLANQEQIAKNYQQITLGSLSNNLCNEILIIIQGRIVRDVQFISDVFTQRSINKIAFLLEEKIHGPEEYIFKDNEVIDDDTCMYYIQNGTVEIICVQKVKQLNPKNYFGEISFIANVNRSASAQSVSFVNLMMLRKGAFMKQLAQEDLEKWFEIKFAIEYEQDYSALKFKCYLCEEFGHVAKYCPYCHYEIQKYNKLDVIQRTQTMNKAQIDKQRHNRTEKCNSLALLSDPMIKRALKLLEKEKVNNDYFLVKKQLQKESFINDTMKDFTTFTPNSNLENIIKQQNSSADQIIMSIKHRKAMMVSSKFKLSSKKLMGQIIKKSTKQQGNSFADVMQQAMKQQQLMRRQSSDSNLIRKRILQLTNRRRVSKQYEQIPMQKKVVLMHPVIPELAEESPVQKLKFMRKSNSSAKKTSISSNDHPIIYPDMYRNYNSRRSQSLNIHDIQNSNYSRYSKSVLENMITININHKLFNFK